MVRSTCKLENEFQGLRNPKQLRTIGSKNTSQNLNISLSNLRHLFVDKRLDQLVSH